MSFNHFTQYRFSNTYGITGTLAADPNFLTKKNGEAYARLTLYCKAVTAEDDQQKTYHQKKQAAMHDIPLIAYIKVFDKELLDDVKQLKKGYFVNFRYNDVTWNLSEDAENNTRRVNPTFVANALEVRHIPDNRKPENFDQDSVINNENKRNQNLRAR